MKTKFNFKTLVVLFLVITSLWNSAHALELGFRGESNAIVGIYVKDLKTGNIVAKNNAETRMVPASITKCITSAASMLAHDKDFRFHTRVDLLGSIDASGCFNGTMKIKASGDPTFDSANFPSRQGACDSIAQWLISKGVKSITGLIIVENEYPDQGQIDTWTIDDTPFAYGAGFYGLCFRDNIARLNPVTGKSTPIMPGLVIEKIKRKRGYSLKRGAGSNLLRVYADQKHLTNKNWQITTTMPNPQLSFEASLKEALNNNGVPYTEKSVENLKYTTPIASMVWRSPLLDDILQSLMFRSDNLFAEGMLRSLVPGQGRDACLEAEQLLLERLGVDFSEASILDGSGLSRRNAYSPEFLGCVLEKMLSTPVAARYVDLFPRAGLNGTMKNFGRDTDLQGRVAFKTGSMNGVKCYAGYIFGAGSAEPSHVAVFMVNQYKCSSTEIKDAIVKLILDKIVSFE